MARQKTVLYPASVSFVFFLLLFYSVRAYSVYSGNSPGTYPRSEVLAGFLEDTCLAACLALLTLLSFSLSRRLYFLAAFPLKIIIVVTCYANLQYVNFFGENLRLFDFEYVRNLGSTWRTLFQDLWFRKAELLFLIMPLLALFAALSILIKARFKRLGARKFVLLSSGLLVLCLATYLSGGVLRDKGNPGGFHQSNYFLGMIRDIPSLQKYFKTTRELKNTKVTLADKGVAWKSSELSDQNQKRQKSQNLVFNERPIPLPDGYVWYDENYPFIKIPKGDAARMGYLSPSAAGPETAPSPRPGPLRNVVFIVLESFRSAEVDLFGGPYHLTPNLNALAAKSTLFKNFYGHSAWTAGAEFAMMTSFYDVFRGVNVMRSHYAASLFSLPEILSLFGYTNFWINSWSANFDNSRRFFRLHGNFSILDKFAFPKTARMAGWHYSDEEIMKMAAATMDKAEQPFFMFLLTSTNHIPYEVPEKKFELGLESGMFGRYLDTFHYTDFALGRFFNQIRNKDYFKKTIFFIFADTGNNRRKTEKVSSIEYFENGYHIPLLIYDPSEERGAVVDELAAQIDLAPTVLDLLNIKIANPFIGQSLFRPRSSPYYLAYHGGNVPLVNYFDQSKFCRYDVDKNSFFPFQRKRDGRRIKVDPREGRLIISKIRQMLSLVDWCIYNDRIWDPRLDRFYKTLYQKK